MAYETFKYDEAGGGLTVDEIIFIQNLAAEASNNSANVALTNDLWARETPSGTVDGSNTIFTLSENASEVIMIVDGVVALASNYTFTPGTSTITFNSGFQPFSSIDSLYKPSSL